MLDLPAVPPAKLKPRSNSFSHPETTNFEKVGDFQLCASIIKEEDEDINGYDIGNEKLSGTTTTTAGSKLTKSQSLSVKNATKALLQTPKKRALTLGSEDITLTSLDQNMVREKLKSEKIDKEINTKNAETTKTAIKYTPSTRLSFQGVDYYKCDESRPYSGRYPVVTAFTNLWSIGPIVKMNIIFCIVIINFLENQKVLHRAKTVDGSGIPKYKDRTSTSSLEPSFNRKTADATKNELMSRCNTEKGINKFVVGKDSLRQDSVDGSNSELQPFRQSLEHSNSHSHYCCDETHVPTLSHIIYQS